MPLQRDPTPEVPTVEHVAFTGLCGSLKVLLSGGLLDPVVLSAAMEHHETDDD
jgi:hypothetical protein